MGLHFIHVIADPWGRIYNESSVLQTTMLSLHFTALLFAGGYAVASDRWVLRARRAIALKQEVLLDELAQIHTPVIVGIALLVVTGVFMALADVDTLLVSPVFWIKMSCFILLLLNGLALQRAETKLRTVDQNDAVGVNHGWQRLHGAALRSMSLWAATVLFGTLLTSAS